eukprot:gene4940-34711_t
MVDSIGSSPAYQFVRKHQRHILSTCAAVAVGYGAYKAYHSETAQLLRKFHAALANYTEAMAKASCATNLLASDLHAYLASNDSEIPQSLKQVCRLVQSNELQDSLSETVSNVVRSIAASSGAASPSSEPSLTDKLLEAVFSSRGHSLLGMAIGVATKNATGTFCEFLERQQNAAPNPELTPTSILNLLASENGEKVMSCLITNSIQTAVHSYVDAYQGYNMYEDMVVSISKSSARDAVTDILTRVTACFCREVATAYRKSKAVPVNSNAGMRRSFSGSADALVVCYPTATEQGISGKASSSTGGEPVGSGSKPQVYPRTQPERSARASMESGMNDASSSSVKLNQRMPPPAAQSEWMNDLISLLKERDVRALAVDVVSSATREATRGTIETLMEGLRSTKQEGVVASSSMALSNMAMYRLYAFMSMSLALFMYVVSPRTMDL